jgi:hypothetical protein
VIQEEKFLHCVFYYTAAIGPRPGALPGLTLLLKNLQYTICEQYQVMFVFLLLSHVLLQLLRYRLATEISLAA